MQKLVMIVGVAVLAGCGGSEPHVTLLEREYVALMDAAGRRTVVPADAITEHVPAEGAPWKVLVLDRRSGREQWIPMEEVFSQPPTLAPYIPLTRTDPETFSQAVRPRGGQR
jgi:hypothetical protein